MMLERGLRLDHARIVNIVEIVASDSMFDWLTFCKKFVEGQAGIEPRST